VPLASTGIYAGCFLQSLAGRSTPKPDRSVSAQTPENQGFPTDGIAANQNANLRRLLASLSEESNGDAALAHMQ
jgi:hypothetical protein